MARIDKPSTNPPIATLKNVDYNAPVIRAVQNCVAQMSETGAVTMLSYSVAAGCTEPNFIIRPNYTPRTTDRSIVPNNALVGLFS